LIEFEPGQNWLAGPRLALASLAGRLAGRPAGALARWKTMAFSPKLKPLK